MIKVPYNVKEIQEHFTVVKCLEIALAQGIKILCKLLSRFLTTAVGVYAVW